MTIKSLRTVTDQLPFHLDDTAQVNGAFTRWRRHQRAADQRLVDLWTYCYIYRYFLVKVAASNRRTPLCFDQLVASAFADVQEHLPSIRQPDCYTGWVGTICKHTFVNYLRTRRGTVSLDQDETVALVEEPAATQAHDAAVVHHSICAAIAALPAFLRDITRMRLLEKCSYQTISTKTGKPLATLRTYVNRALSQLRRNERLRTLLEELRD